MSESKSPFPYYSGYPENHKKAQKDEKSDIGAYIEVVNAVLGEKEVLEVVTGTRDEWNGRTDEQDKAIKSLYPAYLKSLRGKAEKAAQKSTRKNLRGAYAAVKESAQATTVGRRSVVLQDFLETEMDDGEDIEEFADAKEAILEDQLAGKIDEQELLKVSILKNLPTEFDTVTAPLMADEGKTCKEIVKVLSEHQQQLKARDKVEDAHAMAAGATPRNSRPDGSAPMEIEKMMQIPK